MEPSLDTATGQETVKTEPPTFVETPGPELLLFKAEISDALQGAMQAGGQPPQSPLDIVSPATEWVEEAVSNPQFYNEPPHHESNTEGHGINKLEGNRDSQGDEDSQDTDVEGPQPGNEKLEIPQDGEIDELEPRRTAPRRRTRSRRRPTKPNAETVNENGQSETDNPGNESEGKSAQLDVKDKSPDVVE